MRLLHTSDWHLGRSFHREALLPAQAEFCRWLVSTAVAEQVDAVLVAGDVFDRAVPPVDAVRLASRTLAQLAEARIPVVLIAGNHDSAARLGFGADLAAVAGVHVRTDPAAVDRPVSLSDAAGPIDVYAVPYLDPEPARHGLGVERSHAAVVTAALDLVRAEIALRAASGPARRSVVVAHAFVTGGAASESERDVSVGGVSDVPASAFAGVDYVALGHLHRAQRVSGSTEVHYSGSPFLLSFSEVDRTPSVTLVDLGEPADAGLAEVSTRLLPVPAPWRVARLVGTLDTLLSDERLRTEHADSRLHVTLSDPRRPDQAYERLRVLFPHVLELRVAAEQERRAEEGLTVVGPRTGSAELARAFLDYVAGPATDEEVAVLAAADASTRAAAQGDGAASDPTLFDGPVDASVEQVRAS